MALIQCPECAGKVSDKATSCPHCGFPIQPLSSTKRGRPSSKANVSTFRLPNGWGAVKYRGGNRRQPYAAFVNPRLVLNEGNGKTYYKYDYLASFVDKSDAYAAVMTYHNNPFSLNNDLTLKQLFDKWVDYYVNDNNYSDKQRKKYESLFLYCTPLYNIKVRFITAAQIKDLIANAYKIGTKGRQENKTVPATPIIKSELKSLFNMLFDYAQFLGIVTSNPSRTFETSYANDDSREGIPYTDDELDILWNHVGSLFVDMTIVQCYSGWRPGEILNLKLDALDIDNKTWMGGSKTRSGKNRTIPIHSKIYPIVERYYKEAISTGRDILFGRTEKFHGAYTYSNNSFRHAILRDFPTYGIENHIPHDGRHTFSTKAKFYNMNDYARKKIMGHAVTDLTDRVYTHLDIDWFRTELEKIK